MKEKKFFDSYVEYRSPVHGPAAAGAGDGDASANGGVNAGAGGGAGGGGGALPRAAQSGSSSALAPYHEEGNFEVAETDWEAEGIARPDPLRRTLDLLWRRRWIVAALMLGVLLLSFGFSQFSRRVYQATATLLVNTSPLASEKRPADSAAAPDAPPTDVPGVDEARRLETQLEIVKTDGVLQPAIARLNAADQAAIARHLNLQVGSIRNTDLVTVTVDSPSPHASMALANAICQSYIEQSQQNNRRAIQSAADSARGQLQTVREDLGRARDDLKNYQAKVGITDGQEQARSVGATLESTRTELAQARGAEAAAAATLAVQQNLVANTAREVVSYTTVTRPTVISLRAQLTQLRLDRIAARAEYAETSDVVRQLDQQIARVQERLASEPENETLPAQRSPNPAYISASESLGRARSELQALRARIPVLERALARAQSAQAQLPAKTARLSQLSNRLGALQTTFDNLGQKVQTLQLSADSQLANGSLASPAALPGVPIGWGRFKTLAVALALGGLLAYLGALLVDRLDEKIHSALQAQSAAQLPILIDVPRIRNRSDQCILTGNAPLLRESFEILTAQLSLAAREMPLRSVLVTSALPGEGKSVSCVNLAVAAAWAGEEIVLIDCDGRRPTLHEFFGLSNHIGWSDVVTGQATLQAAVQPTRIAGLSVLTAGTPHDSPLELLRSPQAQATIDELASLADLVIVDSPPTLLIADATVLATMTDATLLVVSCGEAAKTEIARATRTLAHTGARLLGLVLLKVAPQLGERHSYTAYSTQHATDNLRGPAKHSGSDGDGERDGERPSTVAANGTEYAVARPDEAWARPFDPDRPFDESGGVR